MNLRLSVPEPVRHREAVGGYWSLPSIAWNNDRHAVALKEIGVRVPWRGTGTARRIHDTLLADRSEPYVTLMVNPLAGEGKAHRLYEAWGYEDIGQSQPSAASPVLTAMIRPCSLGQPTPLHSDGL